MFFYTDTADAPWTVVKADDEKRARLAGMQHCLSSLPYTNQGRAIVTGPDPLIVGTTDRVIGRDNHIVDKTTPGEMRGGSRPESIELPESSQIPQFLCDSTDPGRLHMPAKTSATPAKKAAAPKKAAPARAAPAKAAVQATVTLKHLAAELAVTHALPKKQAEAVLTDLVAATTKHLKKGDKIRLAGLGVLQVRKRPARMGRNPATGEAIKIKASKKVAFRPSKELKEAV
jgi:DNA-binding protein HU-beta